MYTGSIRTEYQAMDWDAQIDRDAFWRFVLNGLPTGLAWRAIGKVRDCQDRMLIDEERVAAWAKYAEARAAILS